MTGLLIAIVLFLLDLAIAQIIRIYELAAKASKRDEYVVTNKDNNYPVSYTHLTLPTTPYV